jgi:hypothetical protein
MNFSYVLRIKTRLISRHDITEKINLNYALQMKIALCYLLILMGFGTYSIAQKSQKLSATAVSVFRSIALYLDITPITCPKELLKPKYLCYSTLKMKSEQIKEAMKNLSGAKQILAWQRVTPKFLIGGFFWRDLGFTVGILDTAAGQILPYRLVVLSEAP